MKKQQTNVEVSVMDNDGKYIPVDLSKFESSLDMIKFPGLTGEELVEKLRESATRITEETVERPLTKQDIHKMEERVTSLQARDIEIEDNLKEYVTPLMDERKAIRAETREHVKHINNGFIDSHEELFIFMNHEKKIVDYYDRNGIKVKSRKMLKDEKQLSLTDAAASVSVDKDDLPL